jgi:E3 ubiquitin-protein ligase TRIP12
LARDIENTQIILTKEKIITDEPRFLCQFSRDILPVLIKVYEQFITMFMFF